MAPVAVILYLRPDHARKTLEALANNNLAHETEVYVFVNAANPFGDMEEKENNEAVKNFALNFQNNFLSYQVILREKHLECNASIRGAIDTVLERYDRVIVLEDDIETTPNFLDFMNAALDFYEKDFSVWNVSGYSPMLIVNSVGDTFRTCSFMPWGWGVWKNRWQMVDWERKRENLLQLDYAFLRENMPLFELAARQDSLTGNRPMYWDYIYSLTQARLKADTIFPASSLVKNFGNDGTGETDLDGSGDIACVAAAMEGKRHFDFNYSYPLKPEDKMRFTELLYYRHERSPMDKEAYNKRFWFYIWMRLKNRGARLADYFIEKGIRSIAVYGMGYAGELLCDELQGSDVMVRFVMDRSGISPVEGIPLLSCNEKLPSVDAIVVTVSRAFAEIAAELNGKGSYTVLSLEDVLFDWALCVRLYER